MKTPSTSKLLFATMLSAALLVALTQDVKAQTKEELKAQLDKCTKLAEENQQKADAAQLRTRKAEAEAKVAQALAEENQRKAEEARRRAEKAEANVKAQEKLAIEAKNLAVVESERARRAERAATKLRYLAQAKLMAFKSKEIVNDPIQEGLVALQAYKFHSEYEGNAADKDIYNGLFAALKQLNDPLTTQAGTPDLSVLAGSICKYVKRNLTREEWDTYAGSDLPYDRTCKDLPANDK